MVTSFVGTSPYDSPPAWNQSHPASCQPRAPPHVLCPRLLTTGRLLWCCKEALTPGGITEWKENMAALLAASDRLTPSFFHPDPLSAEATDERIFIEVTPFDVFYQRGNSQIHSKESDYRSYDRTGVTWHLLP